MGGDDADGPGCADDRRDEPHDRPARRRRRGGRLLLALVMLLVAGLIGWSLVTDGDGARDGPDEHPTDLALLGPDLTEAGLRLDDDGDPPRRALGLVRSHRADVDAQDRTAHVTLGTPTRGMELARFAVLWCDMPPEATRGIEVPRGTITVHDVELEVPCAGKDGTPPARGMVALPLQGTAILQVTGDLPSAGSATLAVYTEPTGESVTPPRVDTADPAPPPAPPGSVVIDDRADIPGLFGSTRSRLVEIGPDSQIQVHAARAGGVAVQVDGVPVTDDGDLAVRGRFYEVLGDPALGETDVDELLAEVQTDQWRTQEPDLRDGKWLAWTPGTRTFPVPAALRPTEGQRRTVAVSVTVEGERGGLPQVVVTDAREAGPDAAADLRPLPLEQVDDRLPTDVQGSRLAAAWRVPQDGVLRPLPYAPADEDGVPRLVATWSGTGSGRHPVHLLDQVSTGTVVTGSSLVPLMVVDPAVDPLLGLDLGDWSIPYEDRWRQQEGHVGVVLPPVPGFPDAHVLAYEPVDHDEFDFTDAPAPSSSWPAGGDPPWSPLPPPPLDTLTGSDLEDGELTRELDGAAQSLWITTNGPGRMELLRDGEPLAWESEDGWWSSWTDRAVTTEVPFPPRAGMLQMRVEGYVEGFRVEVRGEA